MLLLTLYTKNKQDKNTMANSNNSDLLATVSTNIDAFLALPCYDLLASIQSNDITLKNFIPSKDNKHVLSGTQDLWRNIDPSKFDFTLPSKAVKPDRPEKPDPFSGKAKQDYYNALEARDAFDVDPNGGLLNIEIDRIATRLLQHDIIRKYDKLQRIYQFVKSHDVSMFTHQEELDLWELPQTVRSKILDIYKASFKANPSLEFTGGLHKIDLTNFDDCKIRTNPNPISVACSLDTVDGINSIIAVKNTAPSASYGFMSKEILGSVLESIKSECNGKTLLKIITRLDTHSGGSKNSTTILANLRLLITGEAPSKGKKSAQ
jgi:hypothetical protein